MKKEPEIKIEWTIVNDDQAWQAIQSAPATGRGSPASGALPAANREVLLAALLTALILLGIGGWMWQRHSSAARLPRELHGVVEQEMRAKMQTKESQKDQVHIGTYESFGNRVRTQVIVYYLVDGKMRPYRETRFYQKEGSKWLRIGPDPQLMGPMRTLQIAHFTIHFREIDAAAVYEVAPKLEQLFVKVSRDVGLNITGATSSYSRTIEITIGGLQRLHTVSFVSPTMAVSSPALLSVPAEMPEATVLYQAMVYPLTLRAIYDMTGSHQEQWQRNFSYWLPSQRSLALWEMWNEGGPLAEGRQEVVHWLFQSEQEREQHQLLPEGYDRLCRTYRIWKTVPWYLYIPLTCDDLDGKIESDERHPDFARAWTFHAYPSGNTISQNSLSSTVMVETILEYIVARYGREKLPEFVQAMGEHNSLESLIPAVFGVSTTDFEADWQSYLEEQYR